MIADRNVKPGEVFIAKYKGETYRLTALDGGDGKIGFSLEGDANVYQSLSKAGSAVMNGIACNGWRFWTREGDTPAAESAPPADKPKRASKPKGEPKTEAAPTKSYADCTDERLEALADRIKADMPNLDGDVAAESVEELKRVEAELKRRARRAAKKEAAA